MKDIDVPYGFLKGNDLYLSAWGDQKDRRIGEIKEDGPEAAIHYFEEKFNDFKGKIDQLVQTIDEAENKGSYLMKLLHLKEQVVYHEGLGDYLELQKVLLAYEAQLNEIIEKNRERNSEIKTALLTELKECVEIVNWQESTDKVQDVKQRWLKTGNAKSDVHDQLEEDFWGIIEDFFERKKAFYEDKKRLTDHRKEKYLAILKQADDLQSLRGKERFDKVKELKTAWGEVGNIPAREYKELNHKFNNLLKGRKELPPPNFDAMREELEKVYSREKAIDKEMLQRYRKSLGSFKTSDPKLKQDRHEVMQRINLIWERDFLENLASKKHRGFQTRSEDEKNNILKKLLNEFIRRDKVDLEQYEENAEKFAGHDIKTKRMLERKLGQQKNKILVKEKLLEILEKSEA